jgi:hypothetical protein
VDQPVAYFHSWARFWELGAGAVLALMLPWLRVPAILRPLLGWAGLGLVVSSGFVLDGGALFPGQWALWPVAGALLVLLGSGGSSVRGPRGLLQVAPLRFIADISYALYLWHWPLLIAYLHYTDLERVDWLGAAAIMTASVVLAWLTTKLVADPAQRFRAAFGGVRALVAAAVCVALVAGGTVVGLTLLERRDAALLAAASEAAAAAAEQTGPSEYPGARALDPRYRDPVPDDVPVQPAPVVAAQDRPAVDGDGCIEGSAPPSPSGVPLTCLLTDVPEPDHPVDAGDDRDRPERELAGAAARAARLPARRPGRAAGPGQRLLAVAGQRARAAQADASRRGDGDRDPHVARCGR